MKESKNRPGNLRDSQNGIDKRLMNKRSYQDHYSKHSNVLLGKPLRVSKRQPCFICDKPDWCGFRIDEFGQPTAALCMRVSSGSVTTAPNGAYVHNLNEMQPISFVKSEDVRTPKADAERSNAVYTALLERLALESSHAKNLLDRGLSDGTIARKLYASIPTKDVGDEIAQELAKEFDLAGVAGFYQDKHGYWRLVTGYWFQDDKEKWNWRQYSGFFVPYRNHKGLILGVQMRFDDATDKGRYAWLSSDSKKYGASSGTPLHFVNPDLVRKTKAVFITEGALKADVIADLCPDDELTVIALAGVKAVNADDLAEIVNSVFPELERVSFVFDMDAVTNEQVNDALTKMENAFERQENLEVSTITWDIELGKGFDDYLLQEIRGGKKNV